MAPPDPDRGLAPGPSGPDGKPATRTRLLRAAEALARRDGPGQLSLEAVAAEAGVSKGGLLYHFPTKARLLEALVEQHLQRTEDALEAGKALAARDGLTRAYLRHFLDEQAAGTPPSPAFLAALAEHPGLLAPVGARERQFLDRLRADASDPDFATLAFLAIHALRAMRLLGTAVLTPDEEAQVVAALQARLTDTGN
ncbi:MAG: TetR/AcrR family transcriptional regulator [Alkalilacustris sp.]